MDDVEKTIKFLLEQQAAAEARRIEADERHERWHALFEKNLLEIEQTQIKQLTMMDRLSEFSAKLFELSEKGQRRLDETQEKLDALISVVDGIVRRQQ